MAVTPLYQRGLVAHYEADELAGADGSDVTTWTDLSPYGRDLTASSAKPVVNTGAINSKKSVLWDGTNNPLANNDDFTLNAGFLVVKINGTFDSPYEGVLSSPTVFGILAGIGGTGLLYDFLYDYYEVRVNNRIYPKSAVTIPASTWVIVYFRFWRPVTIDGIQIGQDRDFTTHKMNGEVAMLALYNRRFCESEISNNIKSIANSYQLALPDVFPYQSSKTDTRTVGKRILSDGQDEPVTRVKRGSRTLFDLTFSVRSQAERIAANAFYDEFYPTKRFIYRDYQTIPPVDSVVRIPENTEFTWNGGNSVNNNSYGFEVLESTVQPATSIPAAPIIPTEDADDPDGSAPISSGVWTFNGELWTLDGEALYV